MKILKMLFAIFLLIGLLTYYCFLKNVDKMKKTFLLTAQELYTQENMLRVNVEIKGENFKTTRTLILTGVVLSEERKEKARLLALSINGVANVENNLKIKNRDISFNVKTLKLKNRKLEK